MVMDVRLRSLDRVILLEDPESVAEAVEERREERPGRVGDIAGHAGEEIVKARILDGERAVHIGLAQPQPRVEEEIPPELRIVKPRGHGRTGTAAKDMGSPVGVDNLYGSVPNDRSQQVREEHFLSTPQ